LFGTGLVLGAVVLTVPGAERVAGRLAPGIDPATTILIGSVILLGAVTIAYTYFGGMSAVLWTDAVQLVVYIGGSLIAAVVLLQLIPGGWREVVDVGTACLISRGTQPEATPSGRVSSAARASPSPPTGPTS
jgi:Na+/proline symporter